MDQSRRAVEAYWRTRMVDGVTSDESKVAPVYKLEEICDLLRISHAGIAKEVSDYILKRLDHRSPTVKQKTLRLIKYAVGKSGNEFRREMQRHSAAVRQLFLHKGQLDPLKGDAPNKAVRDTAHETIAAIFASDDNKAVAPVESLNKRIQGFGNTNFEVLPGEKKSFLSEVVDLGSATIKQRLSTIASSRKNDTGSYKGPILRRSLTTEVDSHNEYQGMEHQTESWETSRISGKNSGTWGSESRFTVPASVASEDTSSSASGVKSREERLLETIVTSGGVRLQPTRDALQVFLAEAAKLDGVAMSHALELKLQSHLWQVRMKAICVLESILRKKYDENFISIVSYFTENNESVIKCTELPQVSLREKAIKVLNLLGGEQTSGAMEEPSNRKAAPAPAVQMHDLIGTSEVDEYENQNPVEMQADQSIEKLKPSGQLVDVLFGIDPLSDLSPATNANQDDPFADVSFHVTADKEHSDLFSGLTVGDNREDSALNLTESKKTDFLDVFGANSGTLQDEAGKDKDNVHDLMAGLTINRTNQEKKQPGTFGASGDAFSGVSFFTNESQPSQIPMDASMKGSIDLNSINSQAPMQYGMPPNVMFNQGFVAQPVDYNAMSALIAQQELLLQNLGNFNAEYGQAAVSAMLPDIFQHANNPVQNYASKTKSPKEDSKAFDFISDHLASARGSKKVS